MTRNPEALLKATAVERRGGREVEGGGGPCWFRDGCVNGQGPDRGESGVEIGRAHV